jgi:hypothetical protein
VALSLFDDFIRPEQHGPGNRQFERSRCLKIDDKFKFCRLLDGEIGGFGRRKRLKPSPKPLSKSTVIDRR